MPATIAVMGGVLAAASGLTVSAICFAFGWAWYVGIVVLALTPRRSIG